MSRREIRYTVRLSEQEYQQLKKKILENNECTFKYGTKKDRVNISAYIRDTLFREEKEERQYYRELKNLNFQIRKIGVNINQVAAKINSGYKKYDSVFYLQKSLSQVEEEVKKLIERLEEYSGNHKTDEYQAGEDGRGQTLK